MRISTLVAVAIVTVGVGQGLAARAEDGNVTHAIPGRPADGAVIHLTATGTVQVSPDELVADLVATATSSAPAAAQRRVNALITDGLSAARGVTAIDTRAIGYSVAPMDEERTSWTAQQTLELRSADGPALLDLAGKLQGTGFVMATLDWRLSEASRLKAHQQATTIALKDLMDQVNAAAATLGMEVDQLHDVRLGGPAYQPRRSYPMMAMAARAMTAPQATAEPEDVSAEVSGEYLLRPKKGQ